MGPLNGIKVIDLTSMVSGPVAAMMLGDQGAEVVKVEPLAGEQLQDDLVVVDAGALHVRPQLLHLERSAPAVVRWPGREGGAAGAAARAVTRRSEAERRRSCRKNTMQA